MNECIFCKLIAHELPSYPVFEDDETFAFLDIFGATDGHTVVIPKRHGPTLLEYSEDELKAVMATVKKVAAAIEEAYGTKILSIGINHGEPQGVKHLHVHIMPRFEGDQGGIMQSLPGKPLTNKDFTSVAGTIKSHIGK